VTDRVVGFVVDEKIFLALLGVAFLAVGFTYQNAAIARWVGFLFASYAAVGNDSIQTIGTFIVSNEKQRWWLLWIYIGGIFVATVAYSWVQFDGDVSYQRLASKGFAQTPTEFSYLQVAAPLFLLVLTRLRMPVSTTFLLLTSFATTAGSVGGVLKKSLLGYAVSFAVAFAVWIAVSKLVERLWRGPAHPGWRVAQWITTGCLWSVWLQQDAANIAVYLPRSMSFAEFFAFAGVVTVGLGLLFYFRGEKVQQVVDEKSGVVDVRAATLIDFIYALILFFFKIQSKIPMSTTWVFIGLLGGREIAMALRAATERSPRQAVLVLVKDVTYVSIGLLVSLVIAAAVNDAFRDAVFGIFGL